MKITSITRLLSESAYDNISMTATISENEDVIEASIKLNNILKQALDEITKQALDEITNQALGNAQDTEVLF